MKNLFTFSFLKNFAPDNGSGMNRELFALLFCLLFVGVGHAWGATQTFTFNSTAGHTALGITSPSTGSGTDLSNSTDYTLGVVTMNITHGGTNTRIWNKSGKYDLRIYKDGGSLTFTVSSSYKITSVTVNSITNLSVSSPTGGSTSTNTWTPESGTAPTSVTFTASATANVTTIDVVYETNSSVSTPTFSPVAGTYNNNQSVEISCATASSSIYYTTDGTTPTSLSTAYSSAITVSSDNTTIKAIAIKGGNSSSVGSATYRLTCATPTFSVAGGTYNNNQSVEISTTTAGATIYYTTDGSTPTALSTEYSSAITVSSSQTLKAIAIKSNYTNSSVASATYTLKCAALSYSVAGGTYNNDQSVTISTNTEDATIYYTTNGDAPTTSDNVYSSTLTISTSMNLKAIAVKSGYTNSDTKSATYTLTCAQPSFTDGADTYYSDKSEAISTATVGATIYYTTDGSTPTALSTEYSSAVSISSTTTLKAIAIKSGYNNSSVKSATFTIKCVQPTSDPAVGGTYTGPQDIELATTYGTKIYYTLTTDGSTPAAPTTSSTEYTDPIHITTTTKIKAIAWKSGCTNSNQLSGTYTIQYNVTWKVDGETYKPYTDTGEGTDGQALVNSGAKISTLPTAPSPADYCGDRFMGWTDAADGAYVHGTSNLYTTASAFPAASDDQVFYAVFADYVEK